MLRSLSLSLLFVLLSGVVHADELLSPPESYNFPTSPPTVEEIDTPAVTPTSGFASTVTDSAATVEPISATTSKPFLDTNGTTEAPTTHSTNATTLAPTTHHTNGTTGAPTTHSANATTAAPTTTHANVTTAPANATTAIPTNTTASVHTTPVPTTPTPSPNPQVGDYVLKAGSSVCLKAKMGLQFRFKAEASFKTVNLDPNVTVANGSCGSNGADSVLTLMSDKITAQFVFSNKTNKFLLSGLNITLDYGNGSIFNSASTNLSLWEASLGSSYMCRKEQTYSVTDTLILNTFELQVQPFEVTDNKFSTAEECFLDADLSFLVPIAVGVALGFLIILVLISYLIGRRKSRTGYQSV